MDLDHLITRSFLNHTVARKGLYDNCEHSIGQSDDTSELFSDADFMLEEAIKQMLLFE